MNQRSCLRLVKSVVLCACIGFSGCDYAGVTVPSARLELELPEPLSKKELYPLYKMAASNNGYTYLLGGELTPEEARVTEKRFYRWFTEFSDTLFKHHIGFYTPRLEDRSTVVTFVYFHDSTDSFTKEHWIDFFKWKNDYLPRVFPESTIRVKRHPAAFTVLEDLEKIAQETGIPLPERYKISNQQ